MKKKVSMQNYYPVERMQVPIPSFPLFYGSILTYQEGGYDFVAVEYLRNAGFKVFAEEDLEEAKAYLAELEEESQNG